MSSPATITIRPIYGWLWTDKEEVNKKVQKAINALKEVFSGYLDSESFESPEGLHFASTLQLLEENEEEILRISEKMPDITFYLSESVSGGGGEYYNYQVLICGGEKSVLRFASSVYDE